MLSSERATLYFPRSGKSDLFCPFMGFLKLQQQTAMNFNVRNVIGTLSYVTVIPATMSFYWPLTTSVGKAFGINRPSGNKELNSFSQKEWQNEGKGTCCYTHALTNYLAWVKHELSSDQGLLTGLNLLMCGNINNNLLYKQKPATVSPPCDDILHSILVLPLIIFAEPIALWTTCQHLHL